MPKTTFTSRPRQARRILVGPGAVVILLLSLLSVSVSADGVTSTSETEPLQLADWMELVPDDTALSDLAIPGTHDSATANSGQAAIFQPWVETQHWTIKEQLQSGVRAFDIRLTPQNQIAHGNYVVTGFCDTESPSACSSFEHVIREFEEFLDVHPSETVLMRVQENCIDGQACDSALTKSVMKTAVESSTADLAGNSGEAGGTDADADIGDLAARSRSLMTHTPSTPVMTCRLAFCVPTTSRTASIGKPSTSTMLGAIDPISSTTLLRR